MANSTSLRSLGLYDYRAYFADQLFARDLLMGIRWPDGVRCPRCRGDDIWSMRERDGVPDFRCASCRYHFSVTSGTVFARSHLTVSQWIIAIALVRIGVNALGLQWAIGCHYRTASRVLQTIRSAVARDPISAQLSGEIEVDEAYYGGRRKGLRGRSPKGKTIVLGFKERGRNGQRGRAKTIVIPNVTKDVLHAAVSKHVARDSTVYSDGLSSYDGLTEKGYQHLPFDHSRQFILTDVIHTQGIEGHWGVTKPITKARYRKLTPASMPGILAETDFRSNHRTNRDFIGLVLRHLLAT